MRWVPPPENLLLARSVVLRALGGVYLVAFLTLLLQGDGLLGSHGLLPIDLYLSEDHALPTVFAWNTSDAMLHAVAWTGVIGGVLVVLGLGIAPLMALLWALHLSVVHVGQDWYSFGWETQLLETGFIGIFLAPLYNPFTRRAPTPIPFVLLAWLLMRLMWGAGLIKLRGDACWRDLTCLAFHYETQPVPNPLSWLLHQAPAWFHTLGVGFNHLVELIAPFGLLGPRRVRHYAALLMAAFQCMLIASGNLAYLNWLTLVPCLACIDWPQREALPPSKLSWTVAAGLGCAFAMLSLEPIDNLLSSHQRMNTSFNRWHLVNTYGAFGSIGKVRHEIIIEGAESLDGEWKPYEFKCKPGDPNRRPCVISPYHYRLDWLMWFAAMGRADHYPWFPPLLHALLSNQAEVLDLLADNPFPTAPPRFVRAQLYRYRFTHFGEAGVWSRQLERAYVPPVELASFE